MAAITSFNLPALVNALKSCRQMNAMLASSGGALTEQVFSTSGSLSDYSLDSVRSAVAFEFLSLVRNIRALKPTEPIVVAYPDIHYKLEDQISRFDWIINEYGTGAAARWSEVADSIYNDVPVIESAIIAALQASGMPIA